MPAASRSCPKAERRLSDGKQPGGSRPQADVAQVEDVQQNGRMSTTAITLPHVCPVCGYSGLTSPPYTGLAVVPVADTLTPPYCQHFGNPSYEVCACCGFEFGNDDDPGTRPPVSFSAYRAEWIADGAPWFDPSKKLTGWTVE